jgi:hypothetical protein
MQAANLSGLPIRGADDAEASEFPNCIAHSERIQKRPSVQKLFESPGDLRDPAARLAVIPVCIGDQYIPDGTWHSEAVSGRS